MSIKNSCASVVESLETRRQFASVSGTFFDDFNYTAVREGLEAGNTLARIYLDQNNSGTLDAGEPSTTASPSGDFTLQNVPAGTNRFRVILPTGWQNNTDQFNQPIDISFAAGDLKSIPPIGVAPVPGTNTIHGFFYRDTNDTGKVDTGDSLWTSGAAFLDLNNNGVRETSEPMDWVDTKGNFAFAPATPLPAGTYTVRPVTSMKLVAPASEAYTVTLANQGGVTGVSFGVQYGTGSLSGPLFNDVNLNGIRENGEFIIQSGAVYLDLNNNAAREDNEPLSQNYDGFYVFAGLGTGTYVLRALGGTEYTPTANGMLVVNYTAGAITSLPIGFTPSNSSTGAINGTLYGDLDYDGTRDTNETAFATYGVSIYLDLNNNGLFDAGEPTRYTGGTGSFNFTGVAPGTYSLRITNSLNYAITASGGLRGATVTGGERIVTVSAGQATTPDVGIGQVYDLYIAVINDVNNDGNANTGEPSIANRTVWLDLDDDGTADVGEPVAQTGPASSVAKLGGVWPGTYRMRTLLPAGWQETSRIATATSAIVGPQFASTGMVGIPQGFSTSAIRQFTFMTRQVPLTKVYGFVVRDNNGNGVVDTSGEPGNTPGDVVYVDLDNNTLRDNGEPSYTTQTNGFEFYLAPGTYTLRQDLPTGWVQTMPGSNAGHTVTIVEGQTPPILYFGRYQTPTTPTPQPITLQAETATLSGGTVKAATHAGYTGTGFADYAGSGSAVQWTLSWAAAGAARLDFRYANGSTANRPLTVVVNGVTIGTIACAPTGGWTTWKTVSLSVNLKAGSNTIKATAGAASGGNVDSLTITPTTVTPPPPPPPTGSTGTISGYLFNDTDKDGVLDTNESRASGKTVFLDLDADGKLDAGEKSLVTDASGNYSFTGLAAGTYFVRRVFPSGYTYSTPLRNLTLTAGQVVSGVTIGSKTV